MCREMTLCTVHTAKDFLQEKSCGRTCRVADLNLDQSPPNQEKTVFSHVMCTFTGPVPSLVSKKLWGVISAMNPGSITDQIKNDQVIIDDGHNC